MNHLEFDVAVLGSGFAGSLAAWILAKQGRSVVLIEHGKHPRFAIGESSTPLADFKLRQIAERYNLPELEAFTQYGSWKRTHPEITCGVKRGFAYFYHQQDHAFEVDEHHSHELLVTANSSQEVSDTHWLRSDVDSYFVEQAIECGVHYWDETAINSLSAGPPHQIRVERCGEASTLHARFLIVATGSPRLWNDSFIPIASTGILPRTNTRSVFAHFEGVVPWEEWMRQQGMSVSEHPFPCDQSALHHVFDGGWMWQLRFDDETTSVGFSIDRNRHPHNSSLTADAQFQRWLGRIPDVAKQFSNAKIVRPETGMQYIERLQHELRHATGDHVALLPAAVGFADPLFSTGIAHALFSVDQIVDVVQDLDQPSRLSERLKEYDERMRREIDLIDRLVSLAYRATGNFQKFVASTMSYFAAATVCEQTATQAETMSASPAFLLADNINFLTAIDRIEQAFAEADGDSFESLAAEALRPFNHVGLFTPETPRMYRYTAAEK